MERLVQDQEVGEIVVGLPLDLSGEETEWTAEVRAFAEKLGARTGLPVRFVDERLTSVQAERVVRNSGLRRTQREEKERVDATAAAIILRNYLDAGSEAQRGLRTPAVAKASFQATATAGKRRPPKRCKASVRG